ncbi:MAG: radical SAM protein [Anaerolineae bacterium]|nr:radical SAM protein [Anaerolineae bacterium]
MKRRPILIEVDEHGRLVLPPEVARRFGLQKGARLRLEEDENVLRLSRSSASLARVNIEPTNICNLDCRTCMRNVWDEPPGNMSSETFARILEGVRQCDPLPRLFFGGFGEPLSHPRILEMLAAAKALGVTVELITNGILLDERLCRELIALRLDRLWVSLDGATPESYADVRLGAALPQVLANLARLRDLKRQTYSREPRLAIAFVAMRRNIAQLPEILRIGRSLGAEGYSISNVLPHTPELQEEILYRRALYIADMTVSEYQPLVSLPRVDINDQTTEGLINLLKGYGVFQLAGQEVSPGYDRCPFIEKGSLSIRWDGSVAPCLPLLHDHESYLDDRLRRSHAFFIGNINQRGLLEIWNDPAYVALRERLLGFDFSPCTGCNSCEMADANLEDCFGNVQPACGGCLWAQGFIQCP